MAAITSLINGDNMLVMGNEQFIRPMSFGPNWNRLRIIIRFCIYGNSTFIGGLGLGLCKSGTQYYASNSDMIFCAFNTDSALSYLTYTKNASPSCFTFSTVNSSVCAKVGNTVYAGVAGSTNLGSHVYTSAGVYPTRFFMAVDFTRSGNTFTGRAWTKEQTSSPAAITDQTQGSFFNDLENPTPAQISSGFLPNGATNYAGGSGILDCVWMRWLTSVPVLLISDLAVCRYS